MSSKGHQEVRGSRFEGAEEKGRWFDVAKKERVLSISE
jgi:hypothetical protein